MAEEERRQIPIEDGDAEKEKRETGENTSEEKETCEAEQSGGQEQQGTQNAHEPQNDSEEQSEDKPEENAEKDPEAPEEEKPETAGDDKSAEEQESERYMRLMAEFQNFKRRAAREKADIHAYANEKIVSELLPVLDNFERALGTSYDDMEGFAKGMELIFQQLSTALEHAGLAEIPALGEEFDPNVHNAVMTEDSEEHEDGHISKVLQKGYKLNDKVVRPSMVAVVRK